MKKYPKAFIVILNYNGRDFIQKCLTSVFKIDYPNFEVVLVDNNSTDGSFRLAKSNFSRAHFIRNEENVGFAAGNNVGIRFALERMADYVLLLNPDTEAEKDFLSRLVEAAEKEEKIGLVSPVIFSGQNRQIWFSGGKIKWLAMKTLHDTRTSRAETYETDFISGCAMLVKKSVFRKIGLLDEDYFLYWEDADFSFRVKKAGFKRLMVSGSWVYHFEKSERERKNKTYWLVVSGLLFFRKNASWRLRPWISVYVILRRLKNWLDVIFKRNELALVVQKAYRDFQKYGK